WKLEHSQISHMHFSLAYGKECVLDLGFSNQKMKLDFLTQRAKLYLRRGYTFSTLASAVRWEGGVSMVQGASRGIGLEFVRQLLEKKDKGYIVATCRNPSGATGLLELKNKFPERLDIHPLDLTVESTIEDSVKSIRDKYGSVNLLINASGVLSIPNVLQPVQKQH
ncbi:hypothetical protein AABB24_023543, partial [Solanum stoloniferum]